MQAEYIAAGGNRHPAAADWTDDLLAFGSGNNIALWRPSDPHSRGITALLSGHTETVNAVKFLNERLIISGSADKTVRLWRRTSATLLDFQSVACLDGHQSSINTIAALPGSTTFVTGAADATLRVWRLNSDTTLHDDETQAQEDGQAETASAVLLQCLALKPRFFPLATAVAQLDTGQLVLAVAGTSAVIQVYIQQDDRFILNATLTGHEGWIRSMDFVRESIAPGADYLLASASQDKYVRLWRFNKGSTLPAASSAASNPSLGILGKSLSNKAHYIGEGDSKHSITFEALLIGHEDWIYTARWSLTAEPSAAPRLLTASADNSLAIWERESETGLWICTTRLGEISGQKGSTSATGSTGGFWVGLWSTEGTAVTSLGRTGSWRVWKHDPNEDRWLQQVGISGHIKDVKDIAWAKDGACLLSTGSDQTTRLYAEWKRDNVVTWHEMARPQIHGYDLNCIDSLGTHSFISGADEKLLRVFNKPKAVAKLLSKLTGMVDTSVQDLPEAANMPVLSLSNKAIAVAENDDRDTMAATEAAPSPMDRNAADPISTPSKTTLDIPHPPFEDHLARHTLFPEHEKLYGHGYEISAVAAAHSSGLVATACRASAVEHAVIRLYETASWREVKPSLAAHSLTVTTLAFSPDDAFLLSVGRDRQWAIFARTCEGAYELLTRGLKGHARMILDCAWAPRVVEGSEVFATAGRDKCVKVWVLKDGAAECAIVVPVAVAATAVAFFHAPVGDCLVLACGAEDGMVSVLHLDLVARKIVRTVEVQGNDKPPAFINAVRWRPDGHSDGRETLAVAGDDLSVRLYSVRMA